MKTRPVIDHIMFINESSGEWIERNFLPLFDDRLEWAEDVKCPSLCPMACHCHPTVQDEENAGVYHKLCTLTVIRAGLVTREEIIGNHK